MQEVLQEWEVETGENITDLIYTSSDLKEEIPCFVRNKKGKLDGITDGKLKIGKGENMSIRGRSTIKFIFQILIGILLYAFVLSSIMIYRTDASLYTKILMLTISVSIIGIVANIVLYFLYPHTAPQILDFRLGIFYIQPLSFYLRIGAWDSIHIESLDKVKHVEILRMEKGDAKSYLTFDQMNFILKNGNRVALILRKNASQRQIQEDAQTLATRLCVPVIDRGIVSE